MVFRYTLEVTPANTRDNPASVELWVDQGIVSGLDICFPPGCAAWVHTHICLRETPMWPVGGTEDFAWDDYTIEIRGEEVYIATHPTLLKAYAWSEDDTFTHTLTYRIYMTRIPTRGIARWIARTRPFQKER